MIDLAPVGLRRRPHIIKFHNAKAGFKDHRSLSFLLILLLLCHLHRSSLFQCFFEQVSG